MAGQVLCLTPVLPPDVVATIKILERNGLLDRVVTRFAWSGRISRLLRPPAMHRSASRPRSPVGPGKTVEKWSADILFYAVLAMAGSRTRATDVSFTYLDYSARRQISKSVAVFAREDCCVQTFRRAKELGVATIYQLPTGYWPVVRELMERECEEFPNACRAATDTYEFAPERTDRKEHELALADHVLCPSSFVRGSLARARRTNLEVLPFGINGQPGLELTSRKPVFLYVGNITIRKGVHRVLLAWKQLKAYRTHELRLIGDMFLTANFLRDFKGLFTAQPRLPQRELGRHYREAAALVFNPVADGFGHVILEAMHAGTPVIASKNSGAPDTLSDRKEGLLVDYGDQDQLASALDWALTHPTDLVEMGKAAAERVSKWNWDGYGKRFLEWLRPLLKHE